MKTIACALASVTLHAAVAVVAASFLLPNTPDSSGGGNGSGDGSAPEGWGSVEILPAHPLLSRFERGTDPATSTTFPESDPAQIEVPDRDFLALGVGGSDPIQPAAPPQGSAGLPGRDSRDYGSFGAATKTGSQHPGAGTGAGSGGGSGAGIETDPVEIECAQPAYPAAAKNQKIQGSVLISFEVGEDGTVGKIKIARTSGHTPLDEAAIEAVGRWRFKPGTRNGVAIAKSQRVRFTFKLQ